MLITNRKTLCFDRRLKAKNIKSKNVFYLNNGKVDYRPKTSKEF